jgi:AmmeMemoRadiSam system protein A
MTNILSPAEGQILLKTARQAIKMTLDGEELPPLNLAELPPSLQESGACFVTLLLAGQLRGCVGTIEAVQPLILDVRNRAIAAAFGDPRFPPLTRAEFESLEVEISFLSKPEPLFYDSPEDLVNKLRVGLDGVVLKDRSRRATFLPQVWEKLPDPGLFLSRLCLKLGLASDAWRSRVLDVEIYQVEKISEGMLKGE